jgi:hypothetical protein
MNPIQAEKENQDQIAPRKLYETPAVTTFGTVAKLTMTGGSETLNDSSMTTRHRAG